MYVCDRKLTSSWGMYCLRLYVGQIAVTLGSGVMSKSPEGSSCKGDRGMPFKGTRGTSLHPMDFAVMQWLSLCALTTMNFSASEYTDCPSLVAALPKTVSSRQLSSNL